MIPRQILMDSQFEDLHQDSADLSIKDLSTEQVFDLWEKAQRILLSIQDTLPLGQAVFLHGEHLLLMELMRRSLDGDALTSRSIVCDKYAPAEVMVDASMEEASLDDDAEDEDQM